MTQPQANQQPDQEQEKRQEQAQAQEQETQTLQNYIGKIVLKQTITKQGITHERLYCTGIENNILIVKNKNNITFQIPHTKVILFGKPFATDFEDLGIPHDTDIP